jgi:glycyl-tRNA synthetase beta subunit
MNDTVLIELRTEELPPKSLKALSEPLPRSVFAALAAQGFAPPTASARPTRPRAGWR